MIRWLLSVLSVRDRPLQDRLAVLVAVAVSAAVAVTGFAAYLITTVTVYSQLDAELVDVATVTSNWIAGDLDSMGGLDVDALRTVAEGVNALRTAEMGILLITHYERILNYIQPDFVHVLVNGRIVRSGDASLAKQIETTGYDPILQELGLSREKEEAAAR